LLIEFRWISLIRLLARWRKKWIVAQSPDAA
jgi:hypothetical protein